ncbi:GreA/GreB family elongation factor [Spirosoma utsteinense]|uniref:Transcription elongation GreA/GreB family factor n=1 Tax=Spirosoma utsteinense TaxID=2585773 RepID=A0ABR6WA99_9BACT|nr:GreA/GreB family elongation factor [Spirosoma utsteinense]MBC3784019.1 transcription elongation GreA/GreB family factor [Spirosoma utsteinense]MBC3793492.1 transcription elongation GreA/GreB family factor [Spirosoma utsteinense]
MTSDTTKQDLYNQCVDYVQQRINTAKLAMEAAQESANSESKSSAGDKYETGRAMAQLERDRHAQLLAQARKMEHELTRLNVGKAYETVQPGSLVTTNRGVFFISISAGKLAIAGTDYFAVSPASPVATALSGHKVGDAVTFNTVVYQIVSVF